jgi:diguanylate cyclase (GGDEF)-like protein
MPDLQDKSQQVSSPQATASRSELGTAAAVVRRRGKAILSIRARLIVVALVIERADFASTHVLDLARSGAAAQREIMQSLRAMLYVVARLYSRTLPDQTDCARVLTDVATNVPWLRGLGVASTDGRIVCSIDPRATGLNIADRPYFQAALRTHDFEVSDYLINRTDQVPTMVAALTAVNEHGSTTGVILATINLQWLGELAAKSAQQAGTSAFLIDGNGTLIAAPADDKELIGKNFADQPLTTHLLANDEGTVTLAGFDGVPRIFAYVRVPWTNARLAVGLEQAVAHSGIDREISIAYVQLVLFGAAVLLAAWFGGEHLILRPIRSLVRTATRFGRGDLKARAADEPWVAEFRPLAVAFDDMARRLAAREEELQIANQHLEELASLDGLTGLANRRGFDRELETIWQREGEQQRPLALMMIDIDHFKLFNDRYGHVRGDACLRAVGETLSLVTLEDAIMVARYGGEEFALLLPGLDLVRATALAEEARRAIEDLLIVHDEAPSRVVTISIGVESRVPDVGQSAAGLVEAADRALYAAKRCGRNRVVANLPMVLSAAG